MKVELAHDFLAKKIYEESSVEDKNRSKAARYLQECFVAYRYNDENLLLTANDLQYLKPYLDKLEYNQVLQNYIEESKKKVKKEKQWSAFKKYGAVVAITLAFITPWGIWEVNKSNHYQGRVAQMEDSLYIMRKNNTNNNNTALAKIPTNFRTVQFSGKITNEYNQPMEGAKIHLLGATTQTNQDGAYNLNLIVPPKLFGKDITVEFKHLGYQTATVSIDTDRPSYQHEIVLKSK